MNDFSANHKKHEKMKSIKEFVQEEASAQFCTEDANGKSNTFDSIVDSFNEVVSGFAYSYDEMQYLTEAVMFYLQNSPAGCSEKGNVKKALRMYLHNTGLMATFSPQLSILNRALNKMADESDNEQAQNK